MFGCHIKESPLCQLLVLTELLGTIDEFGLHCCLLVGYLYCARLVADQGCNSIDVFVGPETYLNL